MKKSSARLKSRPGDPVRSSDISEVQPFREETTEIVELSENLDGKTLFSGEDLFSFFTADIIKERKLFIR